MVHANLAEDGSSPLSQDSICTGIIQQHSEQIYLGGPGETYCRIQLDFLLVISVLNRATIFGKQRTLEVNNLELVFIFKFETLVYCLLVFLVFSFLFLGHNLGCS